jgi:hypothetical protein
MSPRRRRCAPRTRRLIATTIALALLAFTLVGRPSSFAIAEDNAQNPSDAYAGWAFDAYPNMSSQDLLATLTRMRNAGANLAWIGHNNPAAVDPDANEVGLSYPIYTAALDPNDPAHAAAFSIVAAQVRALDAARAAGLKVVFPINYRTQMGAAWNANHRDSLRRGPDGAILSFGGADASPYAGEYRADTVRYYNWVEQNFVAPYRDVILMLNLADEPTGVDYSEAADSTFFAETGYHFADVGTDQARATRLGDFQSHVMVDFATWAAQQWLDIDPAVTVTISFDGGPGRKNQQAPALEDIFREAPKNFQPTWSAYPRDGTPSDAVDDSNLSALSVFLGTVAHFSSRYRRPYWLWSSGNSWGLGEASPDPGSIADAMVNLRMLADVSRQAGGLLRGIAVWNYNVRNQGLYNDTNHPSYNPDDLFERVSGEFQPLRQILQGPAGPGPDAIILAPSALPDRLIGESRLVDIWSFRGYNLEGLVSLARSGATTAVVGTLAGENLVGVRLLVVLARDQGDLTPADTAAIKAFRAGGGAVVDGQAADGILGLNAQWSDVGNAAETFFEDSYTRYQVGPVSAFGLPRLANSFAIRGPGETIAYGGTTHDAPDQVRAWLSLPAAESVTVFDQLGVPVHSGKVGPGLTAVPTTRHAFAIVSTQPIALAPETNDRYFPETGYRVANDAIWDYFSHRGGLTTFGYPVSRAFRFEGFVVQFFQRRIIQLASDGSPRLLNVLDPGLLPYTSFNGATLPDFDPTLATSAPPSADGAGTLAFVRAHLPDSYGLLPVSFGRTYWSTVSPTTAFGAGGDSGLLPGFDLEMWGVPTSAPAVDPNNHNFAYVRFQRGVMMYDTGCDCTEGLLLADYVKSILTGANLPGDLAQEAKDSPLFRQYDPSKPGSVRDPSLLPNTDMTDAFTPG